MKRILHYITLATLGATSGYTLPMQQMMGGLGGFTSILSNICGKSLARYAIAAGIGATCGGIYRRLTSQEQTPIWQQLIKAQDLDKQLEKGFDMTVSRPKNYHDDLWHKEVPGDFINYVKTIELTNKDNDVFLVSLSPQCGKMCKEIINSKEKPTPKDGSIPLAAINAAKNNAILSRYPTFFQDAIVKKIREYYCLRIIEADSKTFLVARRAQLLGKNITTYAQYYGPSCMTGLILGCLGYAMCPILVHSLQTSR